MSSPPSPEDHGRDGPATLAHRRLQEGLLAWGAPRPPVPTGLSEELRARLEKGLAEVDVVGALQDRPDGVLWITPSRLQRLVCDGYQRDPRPFAHSRSGAKGALVHKAIARAWEERSRPATDVVAEAWAELASDRPGDPGGLAAWLNATSTSDAAALRSEATLLLEGFREVWPPLDPVEAVARPRLRVRLAGGRVLLAGTPGVLLRSPRRDDHCRTLLVDLTTSRPDAERDRDRLRLHALLATIEEGRPPFRWATYHVVEGRSEWEDLDAEVLRATTRRVVATVAQIARLARAEEAGESLHAGDWCRFCRREDTCVVAARARASDQ